MQYWVKKFLHVLFPQRVHISSRKIPDTKIFSSARNWLRNGGTK